MARSVTPKVPVRLPGSDPGSVVSKIILFGSNGTRYAEYPSKQLTEDPFNQVAGYGQTLRQPPFSLEQLAVLADAQPVHTAAIEQKVEDVVGDGPQWISDDDRTGARKMGRLRNQGQQIELDRWWRSLQDDDYTMLELLLQMWNDFDVLGMGAIEIARDLNGIVRKLYYLPSHTLRAHPDGARFAQMRNGRLVWFKKWGVDGAPDIDVNGELMDSSTPRMYQANEVLIFRRPNRRSTWYGVPVYIPAFGWIGLHAAARDWNLQFFSNFREPRRLIIITGLPHDVGPTADRLEESLKASNDPHSNILLPIGGDAKVQIETLSISEDMQFERLIEKTDAQTLAAHRVPPDRIGIVRATGLIGGSTSQIINVVNQIYKHGIVDKEQGVLEDRLDRFIKIEGARALGRPIPFHTEFQQLDISDEAADANIVAILVKNCIISINEGRMRLGEDPDPKYGNMSYMEYLIMLGVAPTAAAGAGSGIPGGMRANTNDPNMPRPEQMAPGEPEQGRPPAPDVVHNPLDNTDAMSTSGATAMGKSAFESLLAGIDLRIEDRVEEVLRAKRR